MANRKEVHFFDDEFFYGNGTPNYAEYHSWFSPLASHKLLGEATPIYMYWHDAPRRMWEYNPKMKLIVVLRNPVTRAYSHWNMIRSDNMERLPFWDAIRDEKQRCREALPHQHRFYSYVDRGFYLEQLRRLWRYFPEENVLVLKNNYLQDRPGEALEDVCRFLGVDPLESVINREVHTRPYSSKMSAMEKEYLRRLFEYEIRNIERVLGWDCTDWFSE